VSRGATWLPPETHCAGEARARTRSCGRFAAALLAVASAPGARTGAAVAVAARVLLASACRLCHDGFMGHNARVALLGAVLTAVIAAPAFAQAPVELKSTTPPPARPFEIVIPGPGAREITRVPEADFYRDDQRVPYQPGFIEPFVGRTKGGTTIGASAWTAPQTPVGSLASQVYQQNNGWFGFGITFIWDSPPASPRPSR
jgi:hypothetical protein